MQSDASHSINIYGSLPASKPTEEQLQAIRSGFSKGLEPTLTEEGTSGAYLLKKVVDDGEAEPVAIWKPIDEEPFAPNNPRGMQAPFGSDTCRPGVKSGESSLREVLAYLLDHDHFAGVPPTTLVELSHPSLQMSPICENSVSSKEFLNLISGLLSFNKHSKPSNLHKPSSHSSSPESSEVLSTEGSSDTTLIAPKVGSFQTFIPSMGPIEGFSPSLICADEVHKIAVLDLRILNLDRNEGNILVQKVEAEQTSASSPEYKLIPIDHGLTIPDSLSIQSFDLAWLSYDQAKEPFSKKTLDYIQKLNVDADIRFLETNFKVRPECLRNMKISTLLL